MSRVRVICLALLAAVVSTLMVTSPAGAATVVVHGTVRDASGAPVPGLTVLGNLWDGVVTGADGSYSLPVTAGQQVPLRMAGRYQGGIVRVDVDPFTVTADRTEDVTLPMVGVFRPTFTEPDKTPVVGAFVEAQALVLGPTSSGQESATTMRPVCYTGTDGACDLRSLVGGWISSLTVTREDQNLQEIDPVDLSTPTALTVKTFVLPEITTIEGIVRRPDGTPLAGARVGMEGTDSQAVTADGGGRYALPVPVGSSGNLLVWGSVEDIFRRTDFEIRSETFVLNGARVEDVTLPTIGTFSVAVRQSTGTPLEGARVWFSRPVSSASGVSSGGLHMTSQLEPKSTVDCWTGADGRCSVPVFRPGATSEFGVTPPGGSTQMFPGTVPGDDRPETTARLTSYAILDSAGTRPGRIQVTSAPASGFDLLAASTAGVTVPDGIDAVVGRVDLDMRLPAGSTKLVRLVLPPDVAANAVMLRRPDGGLSDISALAAVGPWIDVSLTDGSPEDPDGVADGRLDVSLVPVVRDWHGIATTSLPTAALGEPYSTSLTGFGPVAPYTWSLTDGEMPPGLSLRADGAIEGTPTALGNYDFTVQMRESTGSPAVVERTFVMTVAPILVMTSSLPDARVGDAYSAKLAASGGRQATWKRVAGELPTGIRLSSTGALYGTPGVVGTFAFSVTASADGKTSPVRELTIVVRPMEIATSSLPEAPLYAAYWEKLTAVGGRGTLAWSVASGALPPGLNLTSAGAVSGRPTAPGSYTFAATVVDQSVPKQSATRTFTIIVTPMTIVTSSLPDGRKGAWYSTQLVASGGKPTLAWSVAGGVLPTGLKLSSAGRITGYPKATGTWTFTVKVVDASVPRNEALRTLSVTIV